MNLFSCTKPKLRFRSAAASLADISNSFRRALPAVSLLAAGHAQATSFILNAGYVTTQAYGLYSPVNPYFQQSDVSFTPGSSFNQTIVHDVADPTTPVSNASASQTVTLFSDASGAYIDVLATAGIGPAGGFLSARTGTAFFFTVSGPDPIPFSITGSFLGNTGAGNREQWSASVFFNGSSPTYNERIDNPPAGSVMGTWNAVLNGSESSVTGSVLGMLAPGDYIFGTEAGYGAALPHPAGESDYTYAARLTLGSVSSVPEASTWAAAGFLGLVGGLTVWRRSRR
jgi:hypothetical protein